jgi:hypothetical protein
MNISKQCIGRTNYFCDIGVDKRADHDRARLLFFRQFVDLPYHIARFFDGIHEGQGHFLKAHALELRKQAVSEHFGRDAGAVGNKECGAFCGHGSDVREVAR